MNFCQTYYLESNINRPNCFKNPRNPSCLDRVLTNKQERFLKAKTVKNGLSDFHKMVVSVSKSIFKKQIWGIVPDDIKKRNRFENFKLDIELLNPENCPCRLRKTFVPQGGVL